MRDCPVLVVVQGSTIVVDWWWWHFINIELPGLRQANSRHRLEQGKVKKRAYAAMRHRCRFEHGRALCGHFRRQLYPSFFFTKVCE
jgi:hypothetical protein